MMVLFIEWPWLALAPALLFAALFLGTRSRVAGIAALVWAGYAVYEYAMQRRWLCTGECNIRVDLLLIYPLVFLLSVVALVVATRAWMLQTRERSR